MLDDEKRMLGITVDRGLDWATLVPGRATVPRCYQRSIVESASSCIKRARYPTSERSWR